MRIKLLAAVGAVTVLTTVGFAAMAPAAVAWDCKGWAGTGGGGSDFGCIGVWDGNDDLVPDCIGWYTTSDDHCTGLQT